MDNERFDRSIWSKDSDDVSLVGASLNGDREAFGQIVTRYQSLVASLAYSATGSLSQSEDLAQETFVAAWKELRALQEPHRLRAWLCGIVRRTAANALRRQRRDPTHGAAPLESVTEPHAPDTIPVERAIDQEEQTILWRSLEQIPGTYREPLILFYRQDQSVERVARALPMQMPSLAGASGAAEVAKSGAAAKAARWLAALNACGGHAVGAGTPGRQRRLR